MTFTENVEDQCLYTSIEIVEVPNLAESMWNKDYPLKLEGHSIDPVAVAIWMEDIIDHFNVSLEETFNEKLRYVRFQVPWYVIERSIGSYEAPPHPEEDEIEKVLQKICTHLLGPIDITTCFVILSSFKQIKSYTKYEGTFLKLVRWTSRFATLGDSFLAQVFIDGLKRSTLHRDLNIIVETFEEGTRTERIVALARALVEKGYNSNPLRKNHGNRLDVHSLLSNECFQKKHLSSNMVKQKLVANNCQSQVRRGLDVGVLHLERT